MTADQQPVERLRAAARLMRERALPATAGPWVTREAGHYSLGGRTRGRDVLGGYNLADEPPKVAHVDPWGGVADADHIASWDPATALYVADLIDLIATRHQPHDASRIAPEIVCDYEQVAWPCDHITAALAVSDAYLGTTP